MTVISTCRLERKSISPDGGISTNSTRPGRLTQRHKHEEQREEQEGNQTIQHPLKKSDSCVSYRSPSCTGQQKVPPRRQTKQHTAFPPNAPNLPLFSTMKALLQPSHAHGLRQSCIGTKGAHLSHTTNRFLLREYTSSRREHSQKHN